MWEKIRHEWETTDVTFKELAEKYGLKDSTVRSRKNREKWERNNATQRMNATQRKRNVATRGKNDASPRGKRREQKNRSGNPNPTPKFPKRNSAAVTHGLYRKYFPDDTLEIMDELLDRSPADLIYDQIKIQYAAILRAQQIMHVESKDEMIKELKREKRSSSDSGTSWEEEYEFQFAWDRHATFLNAQSRAMGELRSLIKQFCDLAHDDDERRLKLEQMQLGIEKTKAEIDKISTGDEDKPIEIVIKRKGEES